MDFGALDGSTDDSWKDREALLGLQLQDEAKKRAPARSWGDTWNDVKGIPTNLLKMGGSLISQPHDFGSLDPTSQLSPADQAAMSPETFASPAITGPLDATGAAVKSGVTAAGDALAGRIPQYDEAGRTSPQMIQRGFDAAAMAGGASAAGTAGRVAADAGKAAAPLAVAEHASPFYSTLDRAVEAGQPRASGTQWLGSLKNQGVKPEEMDWRGATDLLKQRADQPVTKQEFQSHLASNPVDIKPVEKSSPDWAKLPSEKQHQVNDSWNDLSWQQRDRYSGVEDYYNSLRNTGDIPGGSRYAEYQLPGGENYRERLLTLPREEPKFGLFQGEERLAPDMDFASAKEARAHGQAQLGINPGGATVRQVNEAPEAYTGGHWEEPNVLVHRRSTDRTMNATPIEDIENKVRAAYPDRPFDNMGSGMPGKAVHDNVLTPQEAADWSRANQWRSGFENKPGTGVRSLHAEEIQSDWHQTGRKNGYGGGAEGSVPDAPFKKNWHELAAKDMLHEAAKGDYDRVSWTAGGSQPTNPKILRPGEQKPEYAKADAGLKGFYDKMLPDYFNKVGKQYGARVQPGTIADEGPLSGKQALARLGLPEEHWDTTIRNDPAARNKLFEDARAAGHGIHYMDLTPEMKKAILSKGFSTFEDSAPGTALDVASHVGDANAAGAKAGLDVGRGVGGTPGGAEGLEQAQAAAARHAGTYEPLAGLPQGPFPIGGKPYVAGPIASVHDVAKDYMASTGRPYQRAEGYRPLDPEHSKAIAKAFDEMKHEPDNPKVKASYDAMIKETRDQYDAAKKSGVKFEPIPPDMADPYAATPRLAAKDVQENNHLWYFPTDQGFGVGEQGGIDLAKHPMMQPSGRNDIHGNPMLNNDLFRVVHDYFGHLKEGNGFRAAGEDNAWRTHANMYSDLAKPAMTTETRGQNSWVNYGPHGETNRKASAADTKYADQKVGLMPDWTMRDRGVAAPAISKTKLFDEQGMPIAGPAYSKEAKAAAAEVAAGPKGAGPLDLSKQGEVPHVEQKALARYVPARGISPRMQDALADPKVQKGIEKSMEAGRGVADWYHTEPLHRAFVDELGPERGEAEFKRYMDTVAATSPRSDVPTNIRNASYYYSGGDPAGKNPYPYGHVAQNLHKQNVETIASEHGWDPMQNPKPASFAENLRGNLEPVTVDTHAFRNIGMRTGDPRFLESQIQAPIKGNVGADSLAGRYGNIRQGGKSMDTPVAVYRPQELVESGKLSMKEAQKIPSFWAAQPKANEYAAAEQLFRKAGNRVGLRPADAQAAAWSGAGQMTGLGTVGTHTFNELFNERVMFTAKMRGEDPQKVLSDFVTGKRALLNDTSHGAAFGALDSQPDNRRR